MSSTTDRLPILRGVRGRDRERGQVLVIFAGGLIAIIAIAALVFDTGQSLLDRRTEQNAADAAALAGARYLPANPGTYQGPCNPLPSFLPAARACQVAIANGFTHGVASNSVIVKIPPGPESVFSNLAGYIEVQISNSRPSIFAGVLGMATQNTGALGVARNGASGPLPYSLLSLDPTGCSTSKITGSPGSSVVVGGAIHVDSNCSSALLVSGNGAVTASSCDIVGQMQVTNHAVNNCAAYNAGAQVSGDPLRELAPPAEPATLGNVVKIGTSKNIPPGCPTGQPLTQAIKDTPPTGCNFNASYSTTDSYRFYPGYYPGGISLRDGVFYFEPGIYWIAGSGLQMNGSGATLISVDTGTTTFGGGILLYNSEDSSFMTQCATNPTYNAGCFGPITLQGSSATIEVKPITTTIYKGMVIFQDRRNTSSITLNGAATLFDVEGTIYAPAALVQLNGSSTSSFAAQIIAWDFQVNGSGAALDITYNPDGLFQLEGVGLVQ